MSTNNISIKNIPLSSLHEVAEIHCSAFPKNVLTLLGKETVRRYYLWHMNGRQPLTALGAYVDDKLVGFLFGGINPRGMTGFLKLNRAYLAWRVFTHPWLITNRLFRERASWGFNSVRRFSRSNPKDNGVSRPRMNSFHLLSIAVDPHYQGKRIGSQLMNEMEAIALRSGAQWMSLTVDCDNHPAIRLSERFGWEKIIRDGVWQGKMSKILNQDNV